MSLGPRQIGREIRWFLIDEYLEKQFSAKKLNCNFNHWASIPDSYQLHLFFKYSR